MAHIAVNAHTITITFALSVELAQCFNGNFVNITCDMSSWLKNGRLNYGDSGYVEDVHIDGLPETPEELGQILTNLDGFNALSALKL